MVRGLHLHVRERNVSRAEFDPTSEKHRVAMIVKWVDPGCTTELQIEHADGTVVRLTSTESSKHDRDRFYIAVSKAFEKAMDDEGI
jgi:predicted RNase H-like nuclease (RuvC/YqgF family)